MPDSQGAAMAELLGLYAGLLARSAAQAREAVRLHAEGKAEAALGCLAGMESGLADVAALHRAILVLARLRD